VSKNIVHSFLWRMVISIKMAPSTGSAWSRRTTCVQFTGLGIDQVSLSQSVSLWWVNIIEVILWTCYGTL